MIASRFSSIFLLLALMCIAVNGMSTVDRLRSRVSQPDLLAQLQAQLQQGLADTQKEAAAQAQQFQSSPQPQQSAPLSGASLVNFLQGEQRAYQDHQNQVAAGTLQGKEETLKDMLLFQQKMSARQMAENKANAVAVASEHATTNAVAHAKAKGGDFTPCHTCVFVLERIKKGNNMLLPAICSEVYKEWPESYSDCHQVLNALTYNGNNVRYWLFEGCFKYEVYRAKEWIKPCPSHVMCSVLKNLDGEPFCQALPMEDPFA